MGVRATFLRPDTPGRVFVVMFFLVTLAASDDPDRAPLKRKLSLVAGARSQSSPAPPLRLRKQAQKEYDLEFPHYQQVVDVLAEMGFKDVAVNSVHGHPGKHLSSVGASSSRQPGGAFTDLSEENKYVDLVREVLREKDDGRNGYRLNDNAVHGRGAYGVVLKACKGGDKTNHDCAAIKVNLQLNDEAVSHLREECGFMIDIKDKASNYINWAVRSMAVTDDVKRAMLQNPLSYLHAMYADRFVAKGSIGLCFMPFSMYDLKKVFSGKNLELLHNRRTNYDQIQSTAIIAIKVTKDILDGERFLLDQFGGLHCDLKMENVFLFPRPGSKSNSDFMARVGDFGAPFMVYRKVSADGDDPKDSDCEGGFKVPISSVGYTGHVILGNIIDIMLTQKKKFNDVRVCTANHKQVLWATGVLMHSMLCSTSPTWATLETSLEATSRTLPVFPSSTGTRFTYDNTDKLTEVFHGQEEYIYDLFHTTCQGALDCAVLDFLRKLLNPCECAHDRGSCTTLGGCAYKTPVRRGSSNWAWQIEAHPWLDYGSYNRVGSTLSDRLWDLAAAMADREHDIFVRGNYMNTLPTKVGKPFLSICEPVRHTQNPFKDLVRAEGYLYTVAITLTEVTETKSGITQTTYPLCFNVPGSVFDPNRPYARLTFSCIDAQGEQAMRSISPSEVASLEVTGKRPVPVRPD